MRFKTERLQIKPICVADREAVLDLLTDKSIGKSYMLPDCTNRESADPLFRRLMDLSADAQRYVAGIYLQGRFIGIVNETETDGKKIEMGYALLPDYQNRGYATEAFSETIRYLFDRGFETVIAGAFLENAASIRVMEKCGMVRQPHTDQICYRGVTHTCVYYAITKQASPEGLGPM